MRPLTALIPIALAIVSIMHFMNDRKQRDVAEAFFQKYSLDKRRPLDVAAARYTHSADHMYAEAAAMAVRDAFGRVKLNELTDEQQQLWIHAVSSYGPELRDARALMRAALAARPGWPFHFSQLGEVTFAQATRNEESDYRLWWHPLTVAAASAAGADSIASFRAASIVDRWKHLPAGEQRKLPSLLRRAFLDPDFVGRAVVQASVILGIDETVRLLPNTFESLHSALVSYERIGSAEGAIAVHPKRSAGEDDARERELDAIERERDSSTKAGLARYWLYRHDMADVSTPRRRKQLIRFLANYPPSAPGDWKSDPRAPVIRHLLATGAVTVEATAIEASLQSLSNVPDPIRARVAVARGDFYAAETLYGKSPTAGSFEWAPFLIDLARSRIARGELAAATEAFATVPPAARESCDALLVRRAFASPEVDSRSVALTLATMDERVIDAESWSGVGTRSICIDPDVHRMHTLQLELRADAPSLAEFGVDEGVLGTVAVAANGRTRVSIKLHRFAGRHTFFARSRVGGAITPSAAIEQSNP